MVQIVMSRADDGNTAALLQRMLYLSFTHECHLLPPVAGDSWATSQDDALCHSTTANQAAHSM